MLPRQRKTAAHALAVLTLTNVRFAEFCHSKLKRPSARQIAAREAALQIRAKMAARPRKEQPAFCSEQKGGKIPAVAAERWRLAPPPRRIRNCPRSEPQ